MHYNKLKLLIILNKGKNMQEKFLQIEELTLELAFMNTILYRSLKCLEYDEAQNTEEIYLCSLIEEKINEIRRLF